MDTLLLIDGSNLLFQMFYGMPSRITNKEGNQIQGVMGFVGALRKIIMTILPTHICVLFDGEHENPRNALYQEYKSNRPDYSTMPLEDTPFCQLPYIYKALDFLKIPYKEISDFETDDYIATYTKTYQNQMKIVIASWDSDYFSLLNDNIEIYRYRGKKSYICDLQYIQETLHILPSQYTFYKALVGDKSDNIKGIHKIGPVTAANIVNQFNSIDELYNNLSTSKYQKLLKGKKEQLQLNMNLITFHMIKSLPFTLQQLQFASTSSFTTNCVLKKIGVY